MRYFLREVFPPLALSFLVLGFVLAILLLPPALGTYEVFKTKAWIAAREEARVDVRTARRELLPDLRSRVGLSGRKTEEVIQLLGPPDLVTEPGPDGLVEWIWAIARDYVGAKECLVLVLAVSPKSDFVLSTGTDVRLLPPL